jgi:hypothetical protein
MPRNYGSPSMGNGQDPDRETRNRYRGYLLDQKKRFNECFVAEYDSILASPAVQEKLTSFLSKSMGAHGIAAGTSGAGSGISALKDLAKGERISTRGIGILALITQMGAFAFDAEAGHTLGQELLPLRNQAIKTCSRRVYGR